MRNHIIIQQSNINVCEYDRSRNVFKSRIFEEDCKPCFPCLWTVKLQQMHFHCFPVLIYQRLHWESLYTRENLSSGCSQQPAKRTNGINKCQFFPRETCFNASQALRLSCSDLKSSICWCLWFLCSWVVLGEHQ